jgi:undecaprenyl-diphosphatase
MNIFDSWILESLNEYAQVSKPFDLLVAHIIENAMFKGTPFVLVLVYYWFQKSTKIKSRREFITIGLFSSFVSLVIARLLALSLPFRARPFLNPDLHFVRPFGMTDLGLETWSSFPSDHAVLFFSLATTIFLLSRKAGIVAYLYAFFVVCFPRMYFGLHYPTDILVGAVLGVVLTLAFTNKRIMNPLVKMVSYISSRYSGMFYILFSFWLFQIATIFLEARHIMHRIFELLEWVFSKIAS